MISRLLWAECTTSINKYQPLILDKEHQIRFTVTVHIAHLCRNRRQILSITKQNRTLVDASMGCISTRKFNNLYVSVQIKQDKMRWMSCTIIMPHHRIQLKSARAAIEHVILMYTPPSA